MYCPFRIKSKTVNFVHANESCTNQGFEPCLNEECAAYYQGGCLRLVPPAIVVGDGVVSASDVKKLREEMRNAQIMTEPVVAQEPWPSCSNCANHETKAGCADCVLNADNRKRKETLAQNWVPKEVPW